MPTDGQRLLTELSRDALEPGYRAAARAGRARRAGWGAAVALLTVGLLLGLAASQTQRSSDDRAQERQALLARVRAAESRQAGLAARERDLADDVARRRDDALGRGESADTTRARLAALQVAAGTVAVTGPGLVVTLDDAPDATAAKGRVLDVDLRQVVNGLWQAGAEAVAVNGQRLTPTTAIRSAGQAITVNYRSLARPYRVEAVGDPRTLPARFAASPGGSWLAFLRQNYGVPTGTQGADALALPGAPEPALRHAARKEG